MAHSGEKLTSKLASRAATAWLKREAAQAESMPTSQLRETLLRARELELSAEALRNAGKKRLSKPLFGQDQVQAPPNALWAWRPELLSEACNRPFGTQVSSGAYLHPSMQLFHDAKSGEIAWHLVRNNAEADLCAWSLVLESFSASANYLSLVINLPQDSYAHLNGDTLLRFVLDGSVEYPIDAQLRLSLESGPNSETLNHNFRLESGMTEFSLDLSQIELPGRHVTNAWVDLILARCGMNAIHIRDITFAACPRAKI